MEHDKKLRAKLLLLTLSAILLLIACFTQPVLVGFVAGLLAGGIVCLLAIISWR